MALTVVIGPPAAGKSTWVLARTQPGDIVIDYDRLAEALAGSGADSHNHGDALRRVVFTARRAAIREALQVADRTAVYIIHTNPTDADMATYDQAGAHVVAVDPGRDVVMDRIRDQRPQAMVRAVEQWYRSPHSRRATHASTAQSSRAW